MVKTLPISILFFSFQNLEQAPWVQEYAQRLKLVCRNEKNLDILVSKAEKIPTDKRIAADVIAEEYDWEKCHATPNECRLKLADK